MLGRLLASGGLVEQAAADDGRARQAKAACALLSNCTSAPLPRCANTGDGVLAALCRQGEPVRDGGQGRGAAQCDHHGVGQRRGGAGEEQGGEASWVGRCVWATAAASRQETERICCTAMLGRNVALHHTKHPCNVWPHPPLQTGRPSLAPTDAEARRMSMAPGGIKRKPGVAPSAAAPRGIPRPRLG